MNEIKIKENTYITWITKKGFISYGQIFKIIDENTIIVDNGSGGGRGLTYIKTENIVK